MPFDDTTGYFGRRDEELKPHVHYVSLSDRMCVKGIGCYLVEINSIETKTHEYREPLVSEGDLIREERLIRVSVIYRIDEGEILIGVRDMGEGTMVKQIDSDEIVWR